MTSNDWLHTLLYAVPAALLALSMHEFGHAWVLDRLGDPSPRRAGKLSLNPLVHIDALWALMLFVSRLWVKPLWSGRLPGGRRSLVWVALGGPLANVALALFFRLLLLVLPEMFPGQVGVEVSRFLFANVRYNLLFAAVNLLPIPPLDGSRLLAGLLPQAQALAFSRWETGGLVVLVLLLVSGYIYVLVNPIVAMLFLVIGLV